MDNNFQGLNVVAVIIAGAGVGKLLAGRSRWLRWFASLITAAGVGGVLGYAEGYIGSYGQRHDPAATQLALEKEFERLAPALIPIVKQEDPPACRE